MAITIDLGGRTAWVTGGASGIGAAIVSMFSEAGARVVSLDHSYPADLGHHGAASDRLRRLRLDLRDGDDVDEIVSALSSDGWDAEILINNAGITRDATVWNLTDRQWADVIDVNLTGAFRLARAVAPSMRERRAGVIVNIASVNGMRGKFGQANYAASKGGLIAFTKALARELGPRGIRVNAVAPGMIDTPMARSLPSGVVEKARAESALGKIGNPRDIASAVLFLASPLASHITGHVLVVDGGQIA
jgi:acetoacetyl-CoA reductase/3-oxoacyl-[acyl-carrier protein] reductase